VIHIKISIKFILAIAGMTCLYGCSKSREFEVLCDKGGIWEIKKLTLEYYSDSLFTTQDSVAAFEDCGMFIFYDADIGAARVAYLGQYAVTTTAETHAGIVWYPENDQLMLSFSTVESPFRSFEYDRKGSEMTFTYEGNNNAMLAMGARWVRESYELKRVNVKDEQ
jgi:hypothetical protein